ncbi:MAG: sugar phosphate isomerase/epimerase family protein [Verrucomicrobiota bacterium]
MKRKYSVILGNLGNTRDRFCTGYKDNPDAFTMLQRAAKIPHVTGIELVGTWDIRPDNVREMKKLLAKLGLECVSIIPDLFADKRFWKGSYSAGDPKVRRYAMDYTRKMCDVAGDLGCSMLNIWPGQDGYDYLLCADYERERTWLCDAIARLGREYPQLRFALEYKPKEPRTHSYLARMADTLLLAQETGCSNVGVTIDTGHAFVAGEDVGEAIVLAKRAGQRLFHMHFNDNHAMWDDDMIVGTVHSVCYIEMLYWLDRCGYQGWFSMDQYPYREEATDAIGESILWLRQFDQILQKHRSKIDSLVSGNDAVATSRFLRQVIA